MTTSYRQVIAPGDVGSDVYAVKRALRVMGVHGSGGLAVSGPARRRAGGAFTDCLNLVLRDHGHTPDGRYGPDAHAVIAPHFDAYGVYLYRTAAIRSHKVPPVPVSQLTARQAAQRLVELAKQGKYHADNPGDWGDITRTADGKPVWSPLGRWVYLDRRPLDALVWLIDTKGHRVGTYALCSDHHRIDGPHGHVGGFAVDISSIDGHSLASTSAHAVTLAVGLELRAAPSGLRPWQLISHGVGHVPYSDLSALCIPSAGFYGYATLRGHEDHMHLGYYG